MANLVLADEAAIINKYGNHQAGKGGHSFWSKCAENRSNIVCDMATERQAICECGTWTDPPPGVSALSILPRGTGRFIACISPVDWSIGGGNADGANVMITHIAHAIHIHELICMNLWEDWRGGISSYMRFGRRRRSQTGLVSQREGEQILREIELIEKIGREGGNGIAREKKYVLRELLMIGLCIMCIWETFVIFQSALLQ